MGKIDVDEVDKAQSGIEREEAERMKRLRLDVGISPFCCYSCGKIIPEKRRLALPGTPYCIVCATEREERS